MFLGWSRVLLHVGGGGGGKGGGVVWKKICMYRVSSRYTNTSGSLGEREMLWEHESRVSVSTAFSSSPKLSGVSV